MDEKVTGTCHYERTVGVEIRACHRAAKVEHECVICGLLVKACPLHRERLFGEVQQHILSEHPDEYHQVEEHLAELEAAKREGKRWESPEAFVKERKVGQLVDAMRTGPIWLRIMLWMVLTSSGLAEAKQAVRAGAE